MEEIFIKDKEAYLLENYPFSPVPKMTSKKHCMHCGKNILVGDFKVYRSKDGDDLIRCPNAPLAMEPQ